jgi:hypothetical protein
MKAVRRFHSAVQLTTAGTSSRAITRFSATVMLGTKVKLLVDHADAERVRVVRRVDIALALAHGDLAGVRPVIADQHFTSVLLPAPVSPRSAMNEPAPTRSDTLSSAVKAPKRLVMPRTSTATARR